MSLRDRTLSPEEMASYVADEPDRQPITGAGSPVSRIGQKPESCAGWSAREKAAHRERGVFAYAVDEKPAADVIKDWHKLEDDVAVKKHKDLSKRLVSQTAWHESFGGPDGGEESIYRGFIRGTPETESWYDISGTFELFRDSEPFARYRKSRAIAEKVVDILVSIMRNQHLTLTKVGNWLRLLGMCENAHYVLPFPEPAKAQRAEDGNPVAISDRTGQPVIYEGRAFSDKMLDKLGSTEFAKVLGLRETAEQRFDREESAGRASQDRAKAYHSAVAATYQRKSYTQYQLDHEVPADLYRLILRIPRGDSGAEQARLLGAMQNSLR